MTADRQQAGALFTGLEEVVCLLNRGLAYEAHIAEAKRHRVPPEQFKAFGDALVTLYARVTKFLASACRLKQVNTVHRAVHAFWRPEDIIEFQPDCKNLEEVISKQAKLCGFFATQASCATLLDVKTSLSEMKDLVQDLWK